MAEWPPWRTIQILVSPTSWLFCCVSPGRPPTSLSYFFDSLWHLGGNKEALKYPRILSLQTLQPSHRGAAVCGEAGSMPTSQSSWAG